MKNFIFSTLFSFIVIQVVGQTKTVNIQGIVKDTTVKSIEITHLLDTRFLKWEDTKLTIENGAFNGSIQIPFPLEAIISYEKNVYFKNYINNDTKILIDTTGKLHIIGSTIQDEYENEFLPFFQSNDKNYDSLQYLYRRIYPIYKGDFPKTIKDSVLFLKEKYYRQRATLLGEYIKTHPNSYVALWDIYYFVMLTPSHEYFEFEKLFSYFSSQMQDQSFINVLKEKLKGSGEMQVGQQFPNDFFKGNEKMHRKIKNNNQYFLVDFWYSHCAPCAKEFPKLKEIYNKFKTKGFGIVSISVDKIKDKKDYIAAIKKYGLKWNHVWDKDGIKANTFNINFFPTYILLNKKGRIVNSDIQIKELEEFLKANL